MFGFTADGARCNPYENVIGTGNVSSLSPLWVGQTGNVIASSPAVANGMVYASSEDGKLYAFALNGGHARVYRSDGAAPSAVELLANRKAITKPL